MANGSRPGGRGKNIVSGGGNARRRGSGGVTGGPVGGGFHGGSSTSGSDPSARRGSSGSRSTGGGLIGLLLGLLLGGAFNGNNNNGGNSGGNKKGCLSRILILIVVVVVIVYLYRSCSGGGSILSGFDSGSLNSGSGYSTSDTGSGEASSLEDILGQAQPTEEPEAVLDTTPASLSVANIASDTSMYKAHQPDYTVSSQARARYADVSSASKATVMIYLCATDLESGAGMATKDLQEMLYAQLDNPNVNVVVCAGGTSKWLNSSLSAGKNYVFRVTNSGLDILETYRKTSMVDPGNLSAFIQYCAKNYPAQRNMLILWDHGGGSISGYGYDELYPNGTMALDKLDSALKAGGVTFDLIGYDACLMATLETAMVMERYGDYLIASEAVEPGTGWYYTNWLTKLNEDPSADTLDIAKTIIDDFVAESKKNAPSNPATLSVIDLAELSGTLPAAFTDFSAATGQLLDGEQYAVVSNARSKAKDFSTSSPINQIDLIDFALKMGTQQANELAAVLSGCVKYNRASTNVSNAYGVTIYFPYNRLSGVDTALDTYERIGMDSSYSDCIKSFASLAAGGQITTGGSGSVIDVLLGGSGSAADSLSGSLLGQVLGSGASSGTGSSDLMGSLLSTFLGGGASTSSGLSYGDIGSWFDTDRAMAAADYYAQNRLDVERLQATAKNGANVLQLTEEEWALVSSLAVNVYLDDGQGYIDLGLDNTFEFDRDGDLIMDFDGYWMSLDGQIVSFYVTSVDVSGDEMATTGRVPAMLNGQLVDIIVVYDSDHPDGMVAGAAPVYDGLELDTSAKTFIQLKAGDTIDFLCDYYTYEGQYDSTYYLGEQMTLPHGQQDIVVGYAPVGEGEAWMLTYQLTDLYGNEYWTRALEG